MMGLQLTKMLRVQQCMGSLSVDDGKELSSVGLLRVMKEGEGTIG